MKYLKLLWIFYKTSFMADIEYRFNMVLKVLTDILWYVGQLSVFEVIFHHAGSISDWNLSSTRVFMGVLFVVDAFWMLLFSENLDHMSNRVRSGELDLLLVKPVNSQFMLSFKKMNTPYMLNILITLGYLIWALNAHLGESALLGLFWLILTIPCSLIIVYSIRFLFSCLSVIYVNAESIGWLWYQVYRLGTRPDSIYPRWLRYVVLSILPVGFIASVPSRIIMGISEPWMWGVFPLLAAVSFYLSTCYWRYAIKHYASASS